MDIVALAKRTPGKVWLVGAGPGDVELLTVKAWRILQQAEVVLYDALVSPEILALIPASAEMIPVGKRAGKHSAAQDEINQLLVTKAFTNPKVVRLKGGDPFIFGRGGEELQSLVDANIAFEVVPGITAASGTSSYAGIPLTHRDYAQSVTFMTGHCQLGSRPIDWQVHANKHNTLVIYMGILNAELISQSLILAGRDANTPVAIVSKATTRQQKRFVGRLDELALLAADPELEMPALIIIGDVVKLAGTLDWFATENQSQEDTSLLRNHDLLDTSVSTRASEAAHLSL